MEIKEFIETLIGIKNEEERKAFYDKYEKPSNFKDYSDAPNELLVHHSFILSDDGAPMNTFVRDHYYDNDWIGRGTVITKDDILEAVIDQYWGEMPERETFYSDEEIYELSDAKAIIDQMIESRFGSFEWDW